MFSIIIPVYNVSTYILQCLNSVRIQSYTDYEVIVVNDGSTDDSLNQIMKFLDENSDSRFQVYSKENGGLSSARNFGVACAQGDYLIFVDSDDYIDQDLLMELHQEIQDNRRLDVIRYPKRTVDEAGAYIDEDCPIPFHNLNGEKAFETIRINRVTLETAWTYCIHKPFWDKLGVRFPEGRLHEDIGTIPRVLVQATAVSSLEISAFYNYRKREKSIMTTKSLQMDIKKLEDVMAYYDREKKFVQEHEFQREKVKRMYLIYYADALLIKISCLPREKKKRYRKQVCARNVFEAYSRNNLKSILKKMYYRVRLLT